VGEGEGEVDRGEGLAFARGGGGDREDPRAALGPGVVEGGADDAVALDEALVEAVLRMTRSGLVARELRDDAEERRAEVLADVVGGLQGVVEVLEEEGEADAEEGAEEEAEGDVAELLRADGAPGTTAGSTTRMLVALSSEATSVCLERAMRPSRTWRAASTSRFWES
jgi:hypothetical protein